MADDLKLVSVKSRCSPEEWKARVELAALYRLVALYGWDDMIFTHISARVPGPEHHFLINPYGYFFNEITASSLVKVDLDGNIVEPTEYMINPAGFTIHSAIHAAREDAKFVLHVHTDAGIAVAATKEGLLPISQHALIVLPNLAYHDYEGIALDLGERERLVRDIGDKNALMLWNHGTLAVGETAAQCWMTIFYLERACAIQVMASAQGREHIRMAPDDAVETVKQQQAMASGIGAMLAWPGCLRKLDRESPGYDT
ncbi:MAG TPA: class II aldolase/adducin family protein [Hyphomonadaceae bacterium]|nr:class II aldolase/adducin family protein [Hyphomonadaceae bacterium]